MLLGCISAIGYGFAAFVFEYYSTPHDVWRFLALTTGLFLVYAAALWILSKETGTRGLVPVIIFWALVFRVLLLFGGLSGSDRVVKFAKDLKGEEPQYDQFLLYDHDVWRYLWDGHLSARGQNPYLYSAAEWYQRLENEDPVAEEVFREDIWEDIYDAMGYANYTTIYPPLAQALFRLSHWLAPGSVAMFKFLLLLLDMGVCLCIVAALGLLGNHKWWVIGYAWNPLVLKEYVGSAHVDPLMLCCLGMAVVCYLSNRHKLGALTLACAVLSKLTPIFLLPFFINKWRGKECLVFILPFAISYGVYGGSLLGWLEGFRTFASQWVFNPGPWAMFHWIGQRIGAPAGFANIIGLMIVVGVALWCWLKIPNFREGFVQRCFWVLATLTLVSAAVMPWYVPWALMFAVLIGNRAWLLFSYLVMSSYLIYINQTLHPGWQWFAFGALFFSWFLERWFQQKRTSNSGF